ncbi:hypothetical protein A2Z67_02320 [Candidatus Woesebacteria bacterium RBG_13_36_22]|uniref:Uncharacterized protein n=1 Tax=Candidatus Woesebacteria bacterium RBG_13_36_22 TaxID=1802478 RepID=A0A1F7X270_9BACT|nr:MAG: hypothetical protein A2Z67_02320 [Candidatus Woesebacteria bacterium RBG_13_36_22]
MNLNFSETEKKSLLCANGFKVIYSRGKQLFKKNNTSYTLEDAFWFTVKNVILGGLTRETVSTSTVSTQLITVSAGGVAPPYIPTDLTIYYNGRDAVTDENTQKIDGGNACHRD